MVEPHPALTSFSHEFLFFLMVAGGFGSPNIAKDGKLRLMTVATWTGSATQNKNVKKCKKYEVSVSVIYETTSKKKQGVVFCKETRDKNPLIKSDNFD